MKIENIYEKLGHYKEFYYIYYPKIEHFVWIKLAEVPKDAKLQKD